MSRMYVYALCVCVCVWCSRGQEGTLGGSRTQEGTGMGAALTGGSAQAPGSGRCKRAGEAGRVDWSLQGSSSGSRGCFVVCSGGSVHSPGSPRWLQAGESPPASAPPPPRGHLMCLAGEFDFCATSELISQLPANFPPPPPPAGSLPFPGEPEPRNLAEVPGSVGGAPGHPSPPTPAVLIGSLLPPRSQIQVPSASPPPS